MTSDEALTQLALKIKEMSIDEIKATTMQIAEEAIYQLIDSIADDNPDLAIQILSALALIRQKKGIH